MFRFRHYCLMGCCPNRQPFSLLLIVQFLAAVFTEFQFSACVSFQILRGVKQTNGDFSDLCLLASAVNVHGGGLAVDDKVADWQWTPPCFRTMLISLVRYFLLFYNIYSLFVNANPVQERYFKSTSFHAKTTKNLLIIQQVFLSLPPKQGNFTFWRFAAAAAPPSAPAGRG